jgi:hypothetical protein
MLVCTHLFTFNQFESVQCLHMVSPPWLDRDVERQYSSVEPIDEKLQFADLKVRKMLLLPYIFLRSTPETIFAPVRTQDGSHFNSRWRRVEVSHLLKGRSEKKCRVHILGQIDVLVASATLTFLVKMSL